MGNRTTVSLVVAVVVAAALVPWLGVGVAGAASCTTVSGGDDTIVISSPGCYVIEGGESDGDETDSDVSRFVEVQASDVVIDGDGNTIDGSGSGEAIHVDGAYSNVTVRNVTLTDWTTGVYVRDADGVTVEDVTADSGGTGVTVDTTTNASVERVNASSNADHGVHLKSAPGAVVSNVTVDGGSKSSVRVEGSDGATVRDATLTNTSEHGLYLGNSPNASAVRVAVDNVGTDGIHVTSSENATVRDSTANSTGGHGVFVDGSPNVSVVGVTVDGLSLDGVHVDNSDDAVVRDSTALGFGQHGFHVLDSNGDASVRNNTATNGTNHGFRVHHSDGSTVAGNTARDNGAAGLRVSSELATVRGNLFERNAVGVYLYTHSHVVVNNTVRENGDGITLDADNNTVTHNRVLGSTTAGFHYVSGKDALVYDNLFNNSQNTAYDTDPDQSNRWNVSARAGTNVLGGSVVGGNAWFDPSGDGHSELWDDADGDGFSDSNYTVFKTSVDERPLNAADALSVTPASHDYGNVSLASNATKQFVVESHARPNVTVDRIDVKGLNALLFELGIDPTPVTLSTGETVAVNVTFDPTLTGLLSATLSVESDTSGVEGVNATLSGTGLDDGLPTAEAGPNRTVDDGTAVSFDGTNSTDNVGIVSYEWDLGDGNTTIGATPSHTYAAPGTYTVTLNVTDAAGNTDTDTLTVTVTDVTAPSAEAGSNRTVDDGTTVTFDGTGSTDDVGIVSYAWDFGDGNTSTDATANHTYGSIGTYNVTLNATDAAGNIGTDTVTITVADATAPVADAGASRTLDEDVPLSFDGTNSTDDVGIVSYAWDFGDGNTATGATPNHTYTTPGTYTVTLNVSDAAGNIGTDTLTATVADVTAPTVDAGSNQTVDDGTAVSFDGTGSIDNVGIVSYAWDLGDGNTSTGATTNHTYAAPGTYNVTLNVTDAAGNVGTDTLTVTVSDVTAPVADAGPNQTVDDGTAVSFDGTNSTDDQVITSYQWDLGDGNTTTGATVNHTYAVPGTYNATLNVSDAAGNLGTDTLTVTVSDVTAPTADAGTNQTVDDGTAVSFDATNATDDVGVVSYGWDFGDGNTTTGATANHTYGSIGTYTVTLNVTDAAGNVGTDTLTVTVTDATAPVADAGSDQTVEEDTSVTLDATNATDDVGIVSYTWDLGDGNTTTGSTANHTYTTPGTYTVTLNATDAAGNVGTDTVTITVSDVTAPIADAGSNQTVDDGTAVSFDGANSTDNVGIVSYGWDLGDGNTTTGATPSHTYAAPGTYNVTLNATDSAGNVGTDTLTVTVSDVTAPVAEAGANRTVDEGVPLAFDGTNSTDNVGIVSYAWDFGDGNSTADATPNHTYTEPGTYAVTLNVSDDAGNSRTDTAIVTVTDATAPVAEAGANRTVDDGTAVDLDGTGSTDNVGVISYEWDFGDGNTSTGATVNYTYASPGTYTVTLNVTDAAGNSDTDTLTLAVQDATAPTADAGANRSVGLGTSLGLDGSTSTDDVGIASYRWEFGDGNSTTGATVNYTYTAAGTYTATLNVSDAAGNTDTDTTTVTVTDTIAPVAEAGPNRTASVGEVVNFPGRNSTDNVGIVSYEWDFGDGNTSTGWSVNHSYALPGTYNVTLNVTDAAGNTDTDTRTVTVSDVTAPVVDAGANRTVDAGTAVVFDGTNSTDDVGIVSYEWDFGDGDSSTGTTTSHTYAAGNYTVTLNATDAAGNVGTDTLTVTVEPSPTSGDDGGNGGGGSGGGGAAPIGSEPTGEVTITDRTLLNGTATVGEPVVVRVGLANYDATRGELTLDLAANGVVVAERTVAVGTDGRRTVDLRTTFDRPGRYGVAVNGVAVGTVEVTDDPAENSTDGDESPVSPPPEDLSVAVDAQSEETADVSVRGVELNRTVPVEFGDEGPSADGVALSSISFTPTEDDPITMNVTASREPLPGSPRFDLTDNTSGLAHVRVGHSIANEDVDGARVRFEVPASRLSDLETSPDDVALYRHQNGSWTELPTRVLSETDDGYLFVAHSPGLSEFAAGAKQPQFELRTANVAVERIRIGDDVRVQVRITNTGGADGTYTAKLLLNESVVSERRLTIASNGTRQILFNHEVDRPGSYRVLVNDFPAGNVIVSSGAGENGTAADVGSGGASGGGTPFALGVGALSVLLVVGGLFRWRGRE